MPSDNKTSGDLFLQSQNIYVIVCKSVSFPFYLILLVVNITKYV